MNAVAHRTIKPLRMDAGGILAREATDENAEFFAVYQERTGGFLSLIAEMPDRFSAQLLVEGQLLTEDELDARFEPVTEALYGESILDDWQQAAKHEVHNIWTIVDADGDLYAAPGFHAVNRIGFIVCANQWDETTPDAIWDVRAN